MEAPSNITCPECRERYLRTHDAQGRYISHTPVGYLKLFIGDTSQPLICRSYADVRSHILQLDQGATFRVVLVAGMTTVGEGMYTRFGDGVAICSEVGACEGLHLAMREAIPIAERSA